MKKIFFYILLVTSTIFCSCNEEYLDPAVSGIDLNTVFSRADYADQYLNDIYADILPVLPPTQNSGTRFRNPDVFLSSIIDETETNNAAYGGARNMQNGTWSPSNTTGYFFFEDWKLYWRSIRSCNIFLSKIDSVPLNSEYRFTQEIKDYRKGEALCLKAFNYAELIKEFGGVPIVRKYYASTDKDMNLSRATYDESIAYLDSLCDEAAKLLPLTHQVSDLGRFTKGAALAIKARMALYQASPLFNNPEKPDDCPFRGKYNIDKWNNAADAAKTIIDLGVYDLDPDISQQFLVNNSKEIIFERMQNLTSFTTSIAIPNKLFPTGAFGLDRVQQVLYNQIREYEVLDANGNAYMVDDVINNPVIYNPNNPYLRRDPRFYRDCLFNGSKILGQTAELGFDSIKGTDGNYTSVPRKHEPTVVNLQYSTFVHCVKFASKTLSINWDARFPSRGTALNQHFQYYRYAEVLLNYAEAMNEAYGPEVDHYGDGKTALWAVNLVRTRSSYIAASEYLGQTGGMPPIPNGLSKDDFRKKVRHERRIELAFEEHRFWDVRRWRLDLSKLTDVVVQRPVKCKDGVIRYELINLYNRFFDAKMYRMPIPESDIFADKNLIQNPGWPMSPESAETPLNE